jgi:cytochrome c-type biogenesis protein CcsB
MVAGFALRMTISGRAPVTNFYESVVFVAFGAVVLGLVFAAIWRRKSVLGAAAAVTTIALVLADTCPSVLDPSIRPLPPVLRSNFWLAIHVITIMLSYAAFADAQVIGNISLGYYLVGSNRRETIAALARVTYKSLQVGILLLVLGTFLGAAWADYSWGRFWGWDPKEVWALITLLGYLAVVHARCIGWIGDRGLAASSVVCFTLVIMAWYGVNLLGTGLHNYAFGGNGAEYYVFGAVVLQLAYVAAAMARSASGHARPATT